MDNNIFAIMPVEVFMDDRLTKTDLRVLGALLSFRNKTTNLCCPTREQIANRTGLFLNKISVATSHLVELGWLKKTGNGGGSTASSYELLIPVHVRTYNKKLFKQKKKRRIPTGLVLKVFEKNGYRCVLCGNTTDLCADHIYPEALGGEATFNNLQTLCRSCNSKKGKSIKENSHHVEQL